MTNTPGSTAENPHRSGWPVLEILLLIALPLAVLVAGAITTSLAMRSGFTAQEDAPRLVVPR